MNAHEIRDGPQVLVTSQLDRLRELYLVYDNGHLGLSLRLWKLLITKLILATGKPRSEQKLESVLALAGCHEWGRYRNSRTKLLPVYMRR